MIRVFRSHNLSSYSSVETAFSFHWFSFVKVAITAKTHGEDVITRDILTEMYEIHQLVYSIKVCHINTRIFPEISHKLSIYLPRRLRRGPHWTTFVLDNMTALHVFETLQWTTGRLLSFPHEAIMNEANSNRTIIITIGTTRLLRHGVLKEFSPELRSNFIKSWAILPPNLLWTIPCPQPRSCLVRYRSLDTPCLLF
jgi:hypothetical protein